MPYSAYIVCFVDRSKAVSALLLNNFVPSIEEWDKFSTLATTCPARQFLPASTVMSRRISYAYRIPLRTR